MILLLVFLGIYAIILTACVENEAGIGATVATLIALAVLGWVYKGEFSLLASYVSNNTLEVVLYVIGYLIAGVLWSLYKWYLYLLRYKEKWKGHTIVSGPRIDKGTAIMYMSYWYASLTWYLVHKPITKIYNGLYNLVSKAYTNIAKRVLNINTTVD